METIWCKLKSLNAEDFKGVWDASLFFTKFYLTTFFNQGEEDMLKGVNTPLNMTGELAANNPQILETNTILVLIK